MWASGAHEPADRGVRLLQLRVGVVATDLVRGGASPGGVTSAAPLDEPAVREAVDEAGYELTGSTA